MSEKGESLEKHLPDDSETKMPRTFWASLRVISDWLCLICLLITIGIAVYTVEQAKWINPSPSLISILIFSLISGFVLSKSRLPGLLSLLTALIFGLVIVFWQTLLIYPDSGLLTRATRLIEDIQLWLRAESFGAPIPVTIHIALIFGYLTWIIGYFSTWFLIRYHNAWPAILLGTVVILVNLNFWVSQKYYYFLFYMIAALMLVFLTNYTQRRSELKRRGGTKSGWGPAFWVMASLCFIVIAVSVAWTNPGYKISAISDYARAHSPFKNEVQLYWQNFFARVPGSGAPKLIHGGQQEMLFVGSIELSDQMVFIINTNYESYWRTQVYDYYTSIGWKTSTTIDKTVETGSVSSVTKQNTSDKGISYEVIPQVNTNVLPASGDFISGDVPVIEKILNPQSFTFDLYDASKDILLPTDIANAAKSVRTYRSSRRRTDQQLESALPSNLKLISLNRAGSNIQSMTVVRTTSDADEKPVIALSSAQTLAAQQKVTLNIQVPPEATKEQLARSTGIYPKTITDRYLELPTTLPVRVKDLARSITEKASTPYEKVQAIKEYLAKYPYSLTINTPPADADGVDYFLFTQKSGYCTYFASAMAVMLRSVGVPSRMVVGFVPGLRDTETNAYFIRDRDYHAWVDVYFPGLGWTEVDPTPGSSTSQPLETNADASITPNVEDLSPYEGTIPSISLPTSSIDFLAILIGVLSGVVTLIIVLLIYRRVYGRPKNNSGVYSKLVFLSSLAGLGPRPWQTALEFSEQLSSVFPQQSPIITDIVQGYVFTKYGEGSLEQSREATLLKSWPDLRKTLVKRILHLR